MKKRVVIVGAGASGLTAAIFAARQGASVSVLEHGKRPGKKLLATGNGKCNLTNQHLDGQCYRCSQKEFPMDVIRGFDVEQTLAFFRGIGIVEKERNGYVYPSSEQATSVVEVLLLEAERLQIHIVCECEISSISSEAGIYAVATSRGLFQAEALVLAAGSMAAKSTGSDGSGYELARSLGHHIVKPLPALVQLRCQEKWFRTVAGVRVEAGVAIFSDGKKLAADQGELQLTDYGISGIPVFQVSRFAVQALDSRRKVTALLDFLPRQTSKQVLKSLHQRREDLADRPREAFLTGFFNQKLAALFFKLAGISEGETVAAITDRQLEALVQSVKGLSVGVAGSNPFDNAQVCQGGVDTEEVDDRTLESRLQRGLYITGELLDVDGICGGYNLQWAWSTGALAGMSAGRKS